MKFLILTDKNINDEHICCSFKDRKLATSTCLRKKMMNNKNQEGRSKE